MLAYLPVVPAQGPGPPKDAHSISPEPPLNLGPIGVGLSEMLCFTMVFTPFFFFLETNASPPSAWLSKTAIPYETVVIFSISHVQALLYWHLWRKPDQSEALLVAS